MKKNKLIKILASISAMGAIGTGTAVGITSCSNGTPDPTPTPAGTWITTDNIDVGDKIESVRFQPKFDFDKVGEPCYIGFDSDGMLSFGETSTEGKPEIVWYGDAGKTTAVFNLGNAWADFNSTSASFSKDTLILKFGQKMTITDFKKSRDAFKDFSLVEFYKV